MYNPCLIINLNNVARNVKEIIKKYDDYKYYIGVVKSNAYGHGYYIVNELIKNGINYLAVANIKEALEIRKLNQKIPILILEPIDLNFIEDIIKNNITITVVSKEYLNDLLIKIKETDIKNKVIKIHLKLDTGLNRLGIKEKNELVEVFDIIKNNNQKLNLEGIYSHLATTGIIDKYYDLQVKRFEEMLKAIDYKNIKIIHLFNSINTVSHKKPVFCNGTRLGIIMYGYNISYTENNAGIKNKLRLIRNNYLRNKYKISKVCTNVYLDLVPCIKLVTGILQIKNVSKNEYVGYGIKYKFNEDGKIAIINGGYYNGIQKNSKNVLINDEIYSIIDVDMNLTIIKIDDKIKITDEVVIIGDNITLGKYSFFNNCSLAESLIKLSSNEKKYLLDGKIVKVIQR